ncbi:MAG: DUF29 domain-containing protein [Acidobacteriia bacterium]|nr:DUF29 domain-containing protein [Terriglobia bacterium]
MPAPSRLLLRRGPMERHHETRLTYLAEPIAYNADMPVATSMRELTARERRERGLYDEDFWTWTQEQAAALRARRLEAIDWDNVIEEIETLGRGEKRAWRSHCTNVMAHLLKIEHCPASRDLDHWRKEIVAWQREMHDTLTENPGMKGELSEMLARAWKDGRRDAAEKLVEQASPEDWAAEKRILRSWQLRLPQECPYSLEEIAGYDPFDKESEPQGDLWPAPVARALNEKLGRGYPLRHRQPEREGEHSR